MAAWTTGAWQAQLHTLHLTGCSISAPAFAPMSIHGGEHWPLLQELDTECVYVDAEVIRHLTAAKMPLLRTLRLDRSRGMTVLRLPEEIGHC